MDRIHFFGIVLLLGIGPLVGCGSSASSDAPQGQTAAAGGNTAAPAPSTDAIARAATDFLDAVLKGDSQRASARLTPQAIQRITQSGMPFAPPGLETATFKIGEVRAPSADQAVVQCVLTDTVATGQPQSEEICCLLRRVENDWRISGIAYGTTPDQPWTLSNFETGQSTPIPRPGAPQVGRPSPQRTATQPAPAAVR